MSVEEFPQNQGKRNRTQLLEWMSTRCRECIEARVLAGKMAAMAVGQCDISRRERDFREFMGQCEDGPKLEGECGTTRKVCQHPNMPKFHTPEIDLLAENILKV